jgi:hypothetical protein
MQQRGLGGFERLCCLHIVQDAGAHARASLAVQLILLQRKGQNDALDELLAFSHISPNSGMLDSPFARHFMEPDVILNASL